MVAKQSKTYFPALTGVRAVAAYFVFFHHFIPHEATVGIYVNRFLRQGYIGVSIFFVLSGFLIHQRYGESFQYTRGYVARYVRNRIARIYPLYLLLCLISLALSQEKSSWIWFVNLSLTKGFFEWWMFSNIAQAWTLTVEETFYFLAPLIFWLLRKKHLGTISLTVGFAVVGALLFKLRPLINVDGFLGPERFMIFYTFFGRSFDFLVGIYSSQLVKHPERSSLSRVRSVTYKGLAGAIAVLFLLTGLELYYNDANYHMASGIIVSNWIFPVFAAMTIYGLCVEDTYLSRLLGSEPLEILGKASYAFYLIQYGIIEESTKVIAPGVLGKFFLLNLIAVGLYFAFEAPMNRLVRGEKNIFSELQLFGGRFLRRRSTT